MICPDGGAYASPSFCRTGSIQKCHRDLHNADNCYTIIEETYGKGGNPNDTITRDQ